MVICDSAEQARQMFDIFNTVYAAQAQPAYAAQDSAEFPATPAAQTGAGAASTATRRDSTINYEVDKTIKHTRQPVAPSSVCRSPWWSTTAGWSTPRARRRPSRWPPRKWSRSTPW